MKHTFNRAHAPILKQKLFNLVVFTSCLFILLGIVFAAGASPTTIEHSPLDENAELVWSGSPYLDSSFGNKGIVITQIQQNEINEGNDIAVQADGKIVVAGFTQQSTSEISADSVLIRYLPNGDLDSSFGLSGIVTTTVDPKEFEWQAFYSIMLLDDGKILVGGNHQYSFSVSRYHEDGSLDPTFGQGPISGIVTTTFGAAQDMVQQPDGKYVVIGYQVTPLNEHRLRNILLARYLENGELDPSFGYQGVVSTSLGTELDYSIGNAVALQNDNKILVAGVDKQNYADLSLNDRPVLVRYENNGQLDTAFGNNGIITETIDFRSEFNAVTVQPDGKILAAGRVLSYESSGLIIRYHENGTRDLDFADNGVLLLPISEFQAMSLLDDGKIMVAGASYIIVLEPDGSFSNYWGQGWASIENEPYNDGANQAIVVLDDGEILAVGYDHITSWQRNLRVAKYQPLFPKALIPFISSPGGD